MQLHSFPRKLSTIAFVSILAVACGSNAPEPVHAGLLRPCPDRTDADYFFPVGSVAPPPLDEPGRLRFSFYLDAIEAPSLSCGDLPIEAYRLIKEQRTYEGPAYVVSITRLPGGWRLSAQEVRQDFGEWPGWGRYPLRRWTVTRRVEHDLLEVQAQAVLSALWGAGFWMVPTWKNNYSLDALPEDFTVADWVLEGRLNGTYRVVSRGDRLTGKADEAFKDVGRLLLRLATFPEPPQHPN
jgi:hypothetical protein